MATSSVQVTAGSGTYLATNSISEDAVTKNIQRAVLNNSSGTEIGTNAAPVQVGDGGATLSVDDGAGSLTVDNAALSVTGGGVEASALRVTLASDSTGVLSVDDNGGAISVDDNGTTLSVDDGAGSLTVDNAGTFAVQATVAASASNIAKAEDAASANADVGVPAMAVQKATPANTAGTDGDYEMLQMSAGRLWTSATIDTALPAGTNAIGKLAANSGVDIGDVDITSVIAGTGATNLGKAEDAAASSGDTGLFILGVRRDTPVASASAAGDYNEVALGSAGEVMAQQAPLAAHVAGTASATATTDTSVVAAQGASTYFYATSVTVVNTGSSTTLITFKDGNAGSTLFYAIAPAGGGITFNGGGKVLFKTSANTALYFACGTASTTVYCSVSGFKSLV